MSLTILLIDQPHLSFYAILFKQDDANMAFDVLSNNFIPFNNNFSKLAIPLLSDSNRKELYSIIINDVSNITATENGQFYTIEYYEKLGAKPNLDNDILVDVQTFFWNGQKEVLGVWQEDDRSLTSPVAVEADSINKIAEETNKIIQASEIPPIIQGERPKLIN